jgi:hypothetical protein
LIVYLRELIATTKRAHGIKTDRDQEVIKFTFTAPKKKTMTKAEYDRQLWLMKARHAVALGAEPPPPPEGIDDE